MECIFSVDVEDWFHILDLPSSPKLSEWDGLPSRVETNFRRLLDIFDRKNVQTTCFFLGWVAERFPHLVKEAHARGHEVASHGYSHLLVNEMTRQDFFDDALRSKNILEDLIGEPVLGYRASGFSVTDKTSYMFDELIRAGYRYSSSVFPGPRGHGGLRTNQLAPFRISHDSTSFIEFPISVTKVLGRPLCFFGGGYLRLFPYFLIKKMALKVLKENRPVVFYIHPREIDPDHPRLPMNLKRRFKSYVNLTTTEHKINKILDTFSIVSFEQYISKHSRQVLKGS